MWIVQTLFVFIFSSLVFADTRLSVRQTLGGIQFKDLTKAAEQKWVPQDIEARVKLYYGYTQNPKWTPYKPLKDLLQQLSSEYVLEEYQVPLPSGKQAPYFVARHSSTALDGKAPALQVGLPSMTDYPLGTAINILPQKLWLDKGGIVVLAPINIEDPIVFVSGGAQEKQKLYEKFSDHFAAVARQIIATKKAKQIHFEAHGDLFFIALYTYIRHADTYSKAVMVTPELANYVASTVVEPTPKTWPDVTLQDWYKDLLVKEYAKTKKYGSILLMTDSQNSFVARMAYAFGKQYKLPVEYLEIPQWKTKDVEGKTTRSYIIKYNYLFADK